MAEVATKRIKLGKNAPLNSPLIVYLELSGFCNLKCKFCPQGSGGEKSGLKKDMMSLDLLKKLVNDLTEFDKKPCVIRICGNGEPLLQKNFIESIKYISKKQVTERIELITNALMFTPEHSREAVKYLDRIVVSIEGLNEQDYKNYAQVDINYEELIQKVQYLYECSRGKCLIHIKIHNNAVPTNQSKDEFFKIFGNMCDEISIENLVDLWPEVDFKDLNIDKNKFRYAEYKDDENGIMPWARNHKVCPQIFKSIMIYANGDTSPCCVDWQRIHMFGNIKDKSVKQIWNSERLKKLQIQHLKILKNTFKPCMNCLMNDYTEVDYIDDSAQEILERLIIKSDSII